MRRKLFLRNKYTNCYFKIIKRAQERKKLLGYFENHHIYPKGIGGLNDKENLIKLTAKEHYVCHLLLIKMCRLKKHKRSMCYALFQFKRNHSKKGKRFTGALYEILKTKLKPLISGKNNPFYGKGYLVSGKNNHFYGKHHSKKTKEIIRKSSARFIGELNAFYGHKHTDAYKKQASESRIGLKLKCRNGNYKLIDTKGKIYIVKEGIKSFCKEHDLVMPNVIAAAKKGYKTKGWKVSYVKTS